MLYKLLTKTQDANSIPQVVSLSGDGRIGREIRALGVPVHTFDFSLHIALPVETMDAWAQIRSFQPDLIQGWMYHGNLVAALMSKLLPKTPHVAWNVRHSLYDIGYEKPLTRWVIRLGGLLSRVPEVIIYNSNTSAAQHEAAGYDESRRIFMPNGFDVQLYRPRPESGHNTRAEFDISQSSFVVGHVARYHPMKDHIGFLQALARVREQAENVDVKGLLVGRGVSVENDELRLEVEALNLKGHVHLAGERDDIPRLMNAMDLFVLSSTHGEGFPNVLGEAMASGVPCVTTDVGEAGDIVAETGRVVPPGNPDALADAVTHFVRVDAEEYSDLARQARQRIITHYSLESVAERYGRLYQAVCSGNPLPEEGCAT
jgi:glycosyltransferase involved in cell wall biosynthesis